MKQKVKLIRMRKEFTLLISVICLTIISCTKDEDVKLTVDTSEIALYSGEEHQIEAVSNFPITYLSDNEYVATVSDDGLVKAQEIGETTINVTSKNVTEKISVEVLPKLTVDTSRVTLYSGEEHQIEAVSNFPITYLSENEYVATVSDDGLIKAQKVGETTINVSCDDVTEKISVEVLAEYDLYPEPIMEWGRTRESIISELGEPDANLSNSIGYFFYSPNAPVLMYVFDENDKLESSSVFVKTVFSSELAAFLLERYVYASQDEGVFYFLNGLNLEQSSMSIASSIYNLNYWMVVYFPVENLTTKSMKRNMFQNIFQEFKSLEKSLYK